MAAMFQKQQRSYLFFERRNICDWQIIFNFGHLNCNAASCMHNCDNQCCLNSICVEGSLACQCGETCCSDYEHQKPGATNMCHLPKDSLSISCEATNCIYNTNKKCDADHVDISGIKAVTEDDTVCTTFQARG